MIHVLREELTVKDQLINRLIERNERLTAALLAQSGDVAASVIVRPRPVKDPEAAPAARPIGM